MDDPIVGPSASIDVDMSTGERSTRRIFSLLREHAFEIVFGLCLVATVLPLWLARYLPAVDVPQHMFLVNVLTHLRDDAFPYRDIYLAKPGLTYLAFYFPTSALAVIFGAETAVRVWLSLMLAGIPVSMAVLLRAVGKSPWLALLACPLVFTDNFYWGFISFQSSIPWTLLSVAFFVMSLEEPRTSPRYLRILVASGASLWLVQATHGAAMIFPAAALPLMLLLTPSDWARRVRSVLALVPGVAMMLFWVFVNVDAGRPKGAPGEPWTAHGSLFRKENFVFHALKGKPRSFVELLSNGFHKSTEVRHLYALAAVALFGCALALFWRKRTQQPWLARLRPFALAALGASCFLFLPSEIIGYMNPIDSRYAQVAALCLIPILAAPAGRPLGIFAAAAAAVVAYANLDLCRNFRDFDREASTFDAIVKAIPPKARIMHLVTDWGSGVTTHAVYLHYAALAAARVGGVPSFSLAIDPSFPVGYQKGKKPPASPSEWRSTTFDWQRDGTYYDYYLVRGSFSADTLFHGHAAAVQRVIASGRWTLLRRVP